jgi:dTMP kinase
MAVEERAMPTAFERGFLIVIDGIDGAGKTTQVEALRESLTAVGQVPVVSKEPTDGPWGRKIRDSAVSGRMPPEEELTAFVQDRTEHVSQIILPALAAGRIVILDRYYYSTIAYQGCRGADTDIIEQDMETRFPVPDLTLILDIDPELSIFRIHHSRKEMPNEFEKLDGLTKARAIFRQLKGSHVHILDGSLSVPALRTQILDRVIEGPLKTKRCAKSYGCDDLFHCSFRLTNSCEWFILARALKATLPEYAVL